MKTVILGALSILIICVIMGFCYLPMGVFDNRNSTIPIFLRPLTMPAFGATISVLIGWVNRNTLARLWQSHRIEKADIRPVIALLLGPVLALLMQAYIGLEYFGLTSKSRMIITFTVLNLGFFLVLGNFTSGLRFDSPGGFRTYWTLRSDIVWMKTHRFLGRGLYAISLIGFLALVFFEAKQVLFAHLGSVLILKVMAFGYSILAWRKLGHTETI